LKTTTTTTNYKIEIILKTAVPTVMNLMVVPLVNAVDTFWVGRLGLAVALAAQSAANQACFTLFFLIAFLPNMTAPLVAEAVSSGDKELARKRVCESLFLCNILGTIGTLTLTLFPRQILTALLLPADSPVLQYAAPYLRWRALGMVPSLIAATGSASYRGLLNTVTPLKVSLMTNGVNLILDPLLMFGTKGLVSSGGTKGLGFVGAAVATAVSETLGGMTYIHLLLRRKLATWSMLLKPPPLKSLLPLLSGGAALFLRYLALNIGFLVATRRAQLLDPSGVSGAAYGITMQIYSVGIIALIGMQNAAAALVPSFRGAAKKSKSSGTSDDLDDDEINKAAAIADDKARECADRLFGWSTLVGLTLGIGQVALLPVLVPLFSTLPNVQEAVKIPSLIAALIHVVNGPVLAGEGVMMGVGAYKDLALVTMGYIISMIGCLSFTPLGKRLDGIMWSILISSIVQQIGVVGHYLKVGPLARKNIKKTSKG
jgi:MATE family multidrug resistance protein